MKTKLGGDALPTQAEEYSELRKGGPPTSVYSPSANRWKLSVNGQAFDVVKANEKKTQLAKPIWGGNTCNTKRIFCSKVQIKGVVQKKLAKMYQVHKIQRVRVQKDTV